MEDVIKLGFSPPKKERKKERMLKQSRFAVFKKKKLSMVICLN